MTEREQGEPGKRASSVPGWVRRRKLAEAFGEVLPATTSDERAAGTADTGDSGRWYRENRPPHHNDD